MSEMKTTLFNIIQSRRSTRKYRQEPLPAEVLKEIIEAGRYAPSGGNAQTAHFIAITAPEKLAELREIVTNVLANTPIREGMPAPFLALLQRAQKGPVDVTYGAPALVLVANKKGYANAMADCSCALQDMMLMATAMQVGSCWVNQFTHTQLGEAPPLRTYLESLGLQEDEMVFGSLVLGYAEKLETEPLPRKGNPVTFV